MAAANGHADIVNELPAHGANIDIWNGEGHITLELARMLMHKRVAKIIAARIQDGRHSTTQKQSRRRR